VRLAFPVVSCPAALLVRGVQRIATAAAGC
jgi:hypothetical protein